jgi:hypothetical protein
MSWNLGTKNLGTRFSLLGKMTLVLDDVFVRRSCERGYCWDWG